MGRGFAARGHDAMEQGDGGGLRRVGDRRRVGLVQSAESAGLLGPCALVCAEHAPCGLAADLQDDLRAGEVSARPVSHPVRS